MQNEMGWSEMAQEEMVYGKLNQAQLQGICRRSWPREESEVPHIQNKQTDLQLGITQWPK